MPRPITGSEPEQQRPTPGPRRGRRPEHDRSGRELALQLPEWDLLPPVEFLDRTRRG